MQANHNTFDDGGVLAPISASIEQINEYVLDTLPGEAQHEKSTDRLVTDDSENMPELVSVDILKHRKCTRHTSTCLATQDRSFGIFLQEC